MSLYISDANGSLVKIAGNKSVSNRALTDASNLTSSNVTNWKTKLNIGEIFSYSLSSASTDLPINLSLENGVYKLLLCGTTTSNIDLIMVINNTTKTTYGNTFNSYASNNPTGNSSNNSNFILGIGGTGFSIINLIITIKDDIVIIENNSVANSSGTTYRRNGCYFADGYNAITKLNITTNNASVTMNSGFFAKLYKIG